MRDYDNNREEIFKYREEMATKQAIAEDYDLDNIITNDMGEIWHEVGGQDGMYDNFPIKRVYRDNGTVRVYAIDSGGGVAIIAGKNQFQILTLGEDDGWHFLNSRRIYETYYGSKVDFVYLISEALSLFNNIEL
jgi:hypothetical protein